MFFDFLDFMEIYIVSPDFHWQKSSSTVGRNLFRKNRLGYLDVAIAKKILSVKLAKIFGQWKSGCTIYIPQKKFDTIGHCCRDVLTYHYHD